MIDINEIITNFRNYSNLYCDFYIVAKELNFTRASEKYGRYQSNLSKNVKSLEEILGLNLIKSTNKGINLTSDGEKLYKNLEILFMTFGNFLDSYLKKSFELNGELTIGTTRNIADTILIKYLDPFYKKYPKVKINIKTDNASNLNEYIKNHKIDILIDYLPQINFLDKDNMEIIAINEINTTFACSKKFYKENGNKINTLEDLMYYNLILQGPSRRKQILDELLQSVNMELHPIMEMPDSKLMADFIKKNDCIGYFIEEEALSYDLVPIKLNIEMPKNNIGMVYSKNSNIIVKEFAKLILEQKNK